MSTKFILGAYVSNPNGNDPGAEAAFEAQYAAFTATMGGAAPAAMNAFTDFSQAPSTWAGNAGWVAWSWNKAGLGGKTTPVIGIPMSDNAHWNGNGAGWTNDDFFKDIVKGKYDSSYTGIVDAWSSAGYKTMDLRLGWEMNGDFMPWFYGNDAGTQADWVKAFQHLSTLMRGEATKVGATANIVWNPNLANNGTLPVANSYPGDAYVDQIAVDAYSPLYPYDLYDWHANDGTVDKSLQQWLADPVNRQHFWSYPSANQGNPTGTGIGFGMEDAIAFAKAHNKPLGIAESGAGGNGVSTGPVDDPAFPQWLAAELSKAQAMGVSVPYVNIWDVSMSDGDWNFNNGNKPLEAAAWGQYFGAASGNNAAAPAVTAPVVTAPVATAPMATAPVVTAPVVTAPVTVTPPAPVVTTPPAPAATGLVISVSEDAWQGDANYTVAVDGVQVGGVRTATASHAAGQSQAVAIAGNWTGVHSVAVSFLNDAWGGTASTDRNLYVNGITLNGYANAQASAVLGVTGTTGFSVSDSAAAAASMKPMVLHVSEDAWQGDAAFTVSVDGVQQGGVYTATASHSAGQSQAMTLAGLYATGAHSVTLSFLNDAWGGTAATDRNLYLDSIDFAGTTNQGASGVLGMNGPMAFAVTSDTAAAASAAAAAMQTLVLHVSEDRYAGDAQFVVSVDGHAVGGTMTATASHGAGQSQAISLTGAFGLGPHDVAISFLNDAWGGSAATDRNLFLDGAELNGRHYGSATAALFVSGTQHVTIGVSNAL